MLRLQVLVDAPLAELAPDAARAEAAHRGVGAEASPAVDRDRAGSQPGCIQPQRFQQGCDGGIAQSCFELATLYEAGQGVTRNMERAVALYRQACSAGDARGCGKVKMR